MKRITLLLAAVVAMPTAAPASDAIYRWVDEQGRVHFSDQPPAAPHQKVPLTRRPQPPAPPPSPECEALRARLAEYREAEILVEQDALGNKRVYSEQDKAALIARTEQAMREACQPAQAASEQQP